MRKERGCRLLKDSAEFFCCRPDIHSITGLQLLLIRLSYVYSTLRVVEHTIYFIGI